MKNSVLTGLLATALSSFTPASQAFVIEDQLQQAYNPSGEVLWRTVDFFEFSTRGGETTFDIFSTGWFKNGSFAGIPDASLWLFRRDGLLDMGDLLTMADDWVDFSTDPPRYLFDPRLLIDMSPGQYVLAVGSSGETADILDGVQFVGVNSGPVFNQDPANYRLTVTGDFHLLQTVPEPGTLVLVGIGLAGLMRSRRKS